jgi:hypothetical protein
VTAPTAAQNAFWRRFKGAVDYPVPDQFTPGKYRCPAHDDKGKSLKVSYRDNGVEVGCFSHNCGKQAVLNRLGVRHVDLSDYGPARGGKLAGVFAYVDERGAEVLRAHRYVSPVDVRYEHYRPDGWTWDSAARGPHLLYRLPEVLDAVKAEERVFVVDSEAAADKLREAGVVATTAAYRPPGKPWKPEYVDQLHGAYVTIVARKDEAGRRDARLLAALALDGGAADVELVEPATAKRDADAVDHLAAGFGIAEFATLSGVVEGSTTGTGIVEGAVTIAVAMEAGADVLADAERFLRRYVVFASTAQHVAATLLAAHTHAFEAAEVTPYLHVTSAEKRSAKTLLLDLLYLLARKPLLSANTTVAALFRSIDTPAPTIMFDEVQELFGRKADGDQRELRAVLNAGFRLGGNVRRCVGDGAAMVASDFPVFCPKVLAGTGTLPDMLADRAISIRLKRKTRDATVQRFKRREAEADADLLRRRLAGWAATALPTLTTARPELPEALNDRQQDIWEPLLAIADAAGGDWPKLARDAAIALHDAEPADESVGVLLLGHVREVFEQHGALERITTAELLAALVDRDDGPWGDWWGDAVEADKLKGPAVRLARLLKPYDIQPKVLRFGEGTERGYERAAFTEAWAIYCAEDVTDVTAQVSGHIQHETGSGPVTAPKPALTSNVTSVTSESAEPEAGGLLDDPEWAAAAAALADGEPGELFDGDDHRDPGRWKK